MTTEHIHLMAKWLQDPVVLAFYEGRDNPFDEEKVRRVFLEEKDIAIPCIVSYHGQPIGYIQYYEVNKEHQKEYSYDSPAGKVFGMDQFIGETSYWNKGIGTKMVATMVGFLQKELGAERIILDPQVENRRAVAVYEKCGFQQIKLLPKHEWHEGVKRDCWLMEWRAE
ncbi:N-acetyltransferase [Paenisporosarcina cavernae]|uniref:N-acetyltransferase n=2 Tax=Paenisporosarcina cavernae TaxID=2320858 RepID=A0A385YVE6_9BACL|nr:N-acetyltransferase [Paenisporosarcina cavernae]